jgi:peptidyl-prolyl cis-trans isomerase SurA
MLNIFAMAEWARDVMHGNRWFGAYAARRLHSMAVAVGLVVLFAAPPLAAQQNPFSPRVLINGSAVSNFEVQQRTLMLRALNTPGDLEEIALDNLIDDRLRLDEGASIGINLTKEQITDGMVEFAARTDQTLEAYLERLAQEGVARQTFRDFVHAGMVWREVIRARFGARAQVSEAEINRALALSSQRGAVRVLLSEIILPATDEIIDRTRPMAERLSRITSISEFSLAARQVSVSPTRERGGQLDWLPLENLPPDFSGRILALSPGQVTDPISVPNAFLLFQLRGIESLDNPEPQSIAVEYARFFMEDEALGPADALRAEVDTCDDLYGVAKGLPEERLVFDTLPMNEVPAEIGAELAKLDENEVSTQLVSGGRRVFLMLCGRTAQLQQSPSREEVRQRLANRRLNAFADGYLQELRADAFIRFP